MGQLREKSFQFKGTLPASKSLLNRALVALSYHPELKIIGDSLCEDVQLMQRGLADLLSGAPVECGHAGTVLRFLALRASRIPGTHLLRGSERLFSRPQSELMPILGQLGVDAVLSDNALKIQSRGWRLVVDGLQINAQRSSQFASAVVLNAWGLKFPLHFHVSRRMVSEGYFRMTLQLMRQMGMRIEDNGSEFFIPANQKVTAKEYHAEPDLSSAFSVAAMAVVAGEARIENFPSSSLQPDCVFAQILKDMGAHVQLEKSDTPQRPTLVIRRTDELHGLQVNIESSPDLLPVLSVLCALAKTPSTIEGVGHLKFKESSRLEKSQELLRIMGARLDIEGDRVRIEPVRSLPEYPSEVIFDVDQDHRMAMAARVAQWAGFRIKASDMRVVEKSFPEFLAISEVRS